MHAMHANWRFLFLLALLVAPGAVYGQSFAASLNGAQEVPPNASTATGSATVSVSGNLLTLNLNFSGLTGGAAVAAHIHCCGPAGVNVPVAIPFPGFPATTSGTYFQTFDLTLAATYAPSFLAANGGTAAGAEAALLAGLAGANTYVDIHNAVFPGGEIRGQLTSPTATQDSVFQIGYAANLNIGDSVVNISNDGFNGGVFNTAAPTAGNICVNTYVFDSQEEEIGCCSCLVTPNGLNSLSVKSDLISNNLTPAVPTSVVIKLVANQPTAAAPSTALTVCNPATAGAAVGTLAAGMLAWGSTLEPNSTPGTYNAVSVRFLNASLSAGSLTAPPTVGSELAGMTSLCNFIQANGTGFGICKSCRLGALGGAKQ